MTQEFPCCHSNLGLGIVTSVPWFATTFRGTRIVVTLDLIFEVLHVPRLAYPDYPDCKRLRTVPRDKLLVRLNLFNHMLALFCTKFACNLAIDTLYLGGNYVRVVCERM